MYFISYLEEKMNDDDDYIVGIDSFNNKGQKGDDDFESWLTYDAPLMGGDSTYTITDTTTGSTITFNNEYDPDPYRTDQYMTNKELEKLKHCMPIDLLIKWFPDKKKDIDEPIDILSKSGVGF